MANQSVLASGTPKPFVGRKGMYKAFAASLTGTALEFYDFAVYSAAAAIVFPLIFFPASDPVTGTLLAFSTYAVGYISRPVGGIIFGRLGDEIGRKKILVFTLMLIGVATFLIGLLPMRKTSESSHPPSWSSCVSPRASASAANGAEPSSCPANSATRTAAGSGPLPRKSARPPAT